MTTEKIMEFDPLTNSLVKREMGIEWKELLRQQVPPWAGSKVANADYEQSETRSRLNAMHQKLDALEAENKRLKADMAKAQKTIEDQNIVLEAICQRLDRIEFEEVP